MWSGVGAWRQRRCSVGVTSYASGAVIALCSRRGTRDACRALQISGFTYGALDPAPPMDAPPVPGHIVVRSSRFTSCAAASREVPAIRKEILLSPADFRTSSLGERKKGGGLRRLTSL